MRISTTSLIIICTVFFLSSAFEAIGQVGPEFTTNNRHHTCGPVATATGSFDIVITAAGGSANIDIVVVGQTLNTYTIPMPASFPFTYTVLGLTGTPGGRTYFVTLTDDETAGPDDGVNPIIYNFSAGIGTVTHNTNPGCATPNGAITINMAGQTSAAPFVFSWAGPGGPYNTQNLSGLSGGDYTLTYSDSNTPATSCTLPPIHINDPAPTAFTVSSPDADICVGEVLTVTVSSADNGWTYNVLNGATILASAPGTGGVLNIPVPGLAAGPYTLRVRANAGVCPNRFNDAPDLAVTVNPTPVYNNFTLVAGVCSGTAIGIDMLARKDIASVAATSYNVTNISFGTLTAVTPNSFPRAGAANLIANDIWKNVTGSAVNAVYTVEPVTNSCPGAPFTITVPINPQPDFNNFDNIVPGVCSEDAIGVTLDPLKKAPSVAAASYTITSVLATGLTPIGPTVVSGAVVSGDLANDQWQNITDIARNVTYNIVPRSAGGCDGDPFTVTITVNPQPDYDNLTNLAGVCSGDLLAVDLALLVKTNSEDATSFNITNINQGLLTLPGGGPTTGGPFAANELADHSWRNLTGANINVVYTIEPLIGTCVGNPFTVTIAIRPEPDYNSLNNIVGVCSDAAIGVNLTSLAKGSSLAATIYEITNITATDLTPKGATNPLPRTNVAAGDIVNDVWENLTNAQKFVVYTIIPYNGACEGVPFTVSVAINPEPDFDNYSDGNAPGGICSGDAIGLNLGTLAKLTSVAADGYEITSIVAPNLVAGVGGPATGNAMLIANHTWTNSTASSQTVTYTIVPKNGTCDGDPFTVLVTYVPRPSYANYNNNLFPGGICADQLNIDLHSLQNSGSPQATTFDVTGIVSTGLIPVGFTPATGTGNNTMLGTHIWSNTTASPIDVVYTIVPLNGTCAGPSFTVTVTIRSQPDYADLATTVCSNVAFNINLHLQRIGLSALATEFNITSITAPVDLTNTATTPTVTGVTTVSTLSDRWRNLTTGSLDVTYTIVPVVGTCPGAAFTITVTIDPEPSYLTPTTPTPVICSEDMVNIDLSDFYSAGATATQFHIAALSAPSGLSPIGATALSDLGDENVIANDQWRNVTNAPKDIVYTITPVSADGCFGLAFTVTVTISPQPDYGALNITGICSKAAIGVDLNAARNGSGVVADQFNLTSVSAPNLNAMPGTHTVPVNNLLVGDLALDAWENVTATTQSVTYTVVPVIGTCEGDPFTVTVTIVPEPVYGDLTNTVVGICSDLPIAVNLTTLQGVSSVLATGFNIITVVSTGLTPSTGATTGGTNLAANVLMDDQWINLTGGPVNVIYTIEPVNGLCTGETFTVTVAINPEPVGINIAKDICNNTSANVNLQAEAIAPGNNLPSVAFVWSAVDNPSITGETISTQTTNIIADVLVNTTSAPASVVYTVTPTSSTGCEGSPFTVTVVVNPQPVLVAGQTVQACSGTPVGYEILLNPANLPAGTTFSWPDPDGPFLPGRSSLETYGGPVPMGPAGTTHINDILLNILAGPINVTYVVTPSLGGICNGTPQNVVVTVNRAARAFAGADQALCTDHGAYTLTGAFIAGAATNGTWSFSSQPPGGDGVISVLTPMVNPSTATFTATVPGEYILALTTNDPATVCGPVADLVSITVTERPEIAAAQTKTTCGNDPVAYEIQMNPLNFPNNTVFNWPDPDGSGPAQAGVDVPMGVPGTFHLNDVLINNGIADINVTYVVTPSVGLCVGTPQNIVIIVRPAPVVAFGQTKTICSGDVVNYEILLSPANSPPGVTFSWPDPDGSGPGTSQLSVPADPAGTFHITDRLFNGAAAPIHVIYSVISTGTNGCRGVTRDIDIVVNPGAITEAGAAQSICSNGTATLTGSSIGGLATNGTWTITNSPVGGDGIITGGAATATPASATFTASVAGDYILQLETDDPAGACSAVSDVVTITVKSPGDPSCTGGTGTCATVSIAPIPSPATCNNSDGSVFFDVVPAAPLTGDVKITIDGIGPTTLPVPRTNINSFTFPTLPVGTYSYVIEYGDATCTKTGVFAIDRSGTIGTPVVSNVIDPICFGETGTATIDAPGETGHQLEWSADAITWTPFIAGSPVSGLPAGANLVSVRQDSSDPCASGVMITLADPVQISATLTPADATCNNNDGKITITNLTGGIAPYTFELNGVVRNLPASNVFDGLTADTYNIVANDSDGCARTFNPVMISFPGYVNHTAPVTTAPDCIGGGDNGKVEFTITDPGSFQFAITSDLNNEPTTYTNLGGTVVSVSDLANGNYAIWLRPMGAGTKCSTKIPVTISGVYTVAYTATTSDVVCFAQPTSIILNGIAGAPALPYTYTLTNTSNNSVTTGTISASQALSAFTITGINSGNYSVLLTQDQSSLVSSCTSPINGGATALVVNGPSAALDTLYVKRAISFPDLPSGSAIVGVSPSGLDPYETRLELTTPLFVGQEFVSDWSQVSLNPQNLKLEKSYINLYAGVYTLGLRDDGGCERTYVFTLNVDNNLFIPNVFTPNGDGHNEVFYIRNLPADSKLLVTNRWGKQVFKSAAYSNDWNGGDTVDGVYYYTLSLGTQNYTGWIEIMRGE
jgi:gliding motility-associated-like protein